MMGPSNAVAALDLVRSEVAGRIPADGNPHGGALSPDGRRIYANSMSGRWLSVIDVNTKKLVARIDVGAGSHHSAVRPNGRFVYVAAGSLKVIDATTNEVVASIASHDPPFYPVVSPNGRELFVLNSGTTVSVVDMSTNTLIGTIDMGSRSMMGHLTLAPDGETLYATNDVDGLLAVVDVSTGRRRAAIPVASQPHGVAVSADGARIFVSSRSGSISVVNAKTLSVTATRDLSGRPEHLSITADGKLLLLGLQDRFEGEEVERRGARARTDAVALIDVQSLEVVREIPVTAQVHDILVSTTR